MTIVEAVRGVTGGIDTHGDVHVAAALDPVGGLLGTDSFEATAAGYRLLLAWLSGFGTVTRVGIEGTGAYGAGLARFLAREGIDVVEVDRPNRQARRQHGKSDPLDAIEAARAALSGRAQGQAKTRDGAVEAVRVLLVAKRSARRGRVKALTQMRHLVYTAPELLGVVGVGIDTAASLLVAASDNPDRLHSEAAWAHLCGVAPVPASSGKVTRHRLDRGGDRQANSALWRIVIVRLTCDPDTRAYMARRMKEGRSKREVIRALKRYVAREVYHHLPRG